MYHVGVLLWLRMNATNTTTTTTFETTLTVCAVCENEYYPSGSYECLECSGGNAASSIITIM